MADNGGGNLQGLRLIDLTTGLAGPSCAGHFADMGAEVIRIERPMETIEGRKIPKPTHEFVDYNGALWMWRNGGKKCLGLDLKDGEGRTIFVDLIKKADVFIHNRRPGALKRLALDYDNLKEINPRLIMCAISGFGQFGPLAERPAYDLLIQAMSGACWIGGEPDRSPSPGWVSWVDTATGLHAFSAINAALFRRTITGEGQHIDISMLEAAFTMNDYPILEYLWSDGHIDRTRRGPYQPTGSAWGVFQCADGWVAMTASNNAPWKNLCDLMGKPEMAKDPRYDTVAKRNNAWQEVNGMIEEWTQQFDVETCWALLEGNGITCTKVLSTGEILAHPQIEAREMLIEIEDPRVGRVKLPNTAFKYGGAKTEQRKRAPFYGEHNRDILVNLLGYRDGDVDALFEKGVLAADPAVLEKEGLPAKA